MSSKTVEIKASIRFNVLIDALFCAVCVTNGIKKKDISQRDIENLTHVLRILTTMKGGDAMT